MAMAAESLEVRMARLEGAYEQIDKRLGSIEERLARLEGKVDQLDSRINGRIDAMDSRINGRIDAMDSRINGRLDVLAAEMRRQFYWTLAFIAPLYALIAGLILQQLRR
jgi:tetrahydromethanopterin S-methyltransferase subunit G